MTKADNDAGIDLKTSQQTNENAEFQFPEEDETVLRGWELKHLRTELGFSAAEFADYLASRNEKITTARSVYRLEERWFVQPRYVQAFASFVGKALYKEVLTRLRTEPGYFSSRYFSDRLYDEEQKQYEEEKQKEWEKKQIGRLLGKR